MRFFLNNKIVQNNCANSCFRPGATKTSVHENGGRRLVQAPATPCPQKFQATVAQTEGHRCGNPDAHGVHHSSVYHSCVGAGRTHAITSRTASVLDGRPDPFPIDCSLQDSRASSSYANVTPPGHSVNEMAATCRGWITLVNCCSPKNTTSAFESVCIFCRQGLMNKLANQRVVPWMHLFPCSYLIRASSFVTIILCCQDSGVQPADAFCSQQVLSSDYNRRPDSSQATAVGGTEETARGCGSNNENEDDLYTSVFEDCDVPNRQSNSQCGYNAIAFVPNTT